MVVYFAFFTPLVHSQCEVEAIYLDFCKSLDLVLQALLLCQLDDFGLAPV